MHFPALSEGVREATSTTSSVPHMEIPAREPRSFPPASLSALYGERYDRPRMPTQVYPTMCGDAGDYAPATDVVAYPR